MKYNQSSIKARVYDNLHAIERLAYDIIEVKSVVKNWHSVLLSFLYNKSTILLHLKSGISIEIKCPCHDKETIYKFIRLIHKSLKSRKISRNRFAISLDGTNTIVFDLDFTRIENINLVRLVYDGYIAGADFKDEQHRYNVSKRKSSLILLGTPPKLVETSDGLVFPLKHTNVGIFIETFVRRIHDFYDYTTDKVVVDIGANIGDTALLFAKKGAMVYALEPIKENFKAMLNNINMNKKLKKRIKPIYAAVGENGNKIFYFNHEVEYLGGGASAYVYYSSAKTKEMVKSYSLFTICKKFNIKKVDLLKMDAKGAEFLLTRRDLERVKNLEIEYTVFGEHKLQELIDVIKSAGFSYCIFNHSYSEPIMINQMWTLHGMIYAAREK